jgi:DNA-binding NarL/FixJ family response regulator
MIVSQPGDAARAVIGVNGNGSSAVRFKVLIVDPHPLVVLGLRAALQADPEIDIVGAVHNGGDALAFCGAAAPSLVITEVALPDMSGAEFCRSVKRIAPGTQVLILTACEDNTSVFGAVGAGASGYVLKDISPENFLRAVHAVRRGQAMIHPGIAKRMLDKFSLLTKDGNGSLLFGGKLTEREAEILVEVARGLTNKEIAQKLFLSESTVKTRLRGIFEKLDVRDRSQAAALAIRGGYMR